MQCTFFGNSAPVGGNLSICGGRCTMTRSVVVGATEGAGFEPDVSDGEIILSCVDMWGNAGGDWVGAVADQVGHDGNFSLDPRFCDDAAHDFTLSEISPCAPDAMPGCGLIGAWPVACELPTGAPAAAIPALAATAAPNPCNPGTEIRFDLPAAAPVRLAVYAPDGRLVARLHDGRLPAGPHRVAWRGRDHGGRPVPSGSYLYRLEAGGASTTGRVTVLR